MNNKTLKQLVIEHNNDYGFFVSEVIEKCEKRDWTPHSLSVVIPYYETGKSFQLALKHLYNSIEYIKKHTSCDWSFEVIVIDDGSKNKKADEFVKKDYVNLRIIRLSENQGRTAARNAGLNVAKCEKCLFMDSDVLMSQKYLFHHLLVHCFSKKNAITVGFFQFVEKSNEVLQKDVLGFDDVQINDYRINCTYGKTWIGCESDKQFVGNKYKIVENTNYFRSWPKDGFFGPWFLTNMVLGGFFIVDTKKSKECFGFDSSFVGYGFTETSLPTKLIAGFNHYLIPVHIGGCIHADDNEINVSRDNKNQIFWEKHDFYFNHYLKLDWQQSLDGYAKK